MTNTVSRYYICTKYKMTNVRFEALVNEGKFPGAFVNDDNTWIIPRESLEYFEEKHLEDFLAQKSALKTGVYIKDGKEYISLNSFAKACNLGREVISYHISNKKILDYTMIGNSYFINKELVNDVLKTGKKATSDITLDNFKEIMFSLYKDDKNIKNKEKTFVVFVDFALLKVNQSRSKDIGKALARYKNSILKFLGLLNKELHLCSDEEIKLVLASEALTEKNQQHSITFINYYKNLVKDCKYENTYAFTSKVSERTDKEIYSKEDFLNMYNYVRNIDLHIENALADPLYAELWFYVAMHFTNAWRAEDILYYPLSNISSILSIDKEYLKSISLEEAQSVINLVRDIQRFDINKTGALNKFFVTRDLVRPIAVLISILEKHSSDSDGYLLLPLLNKKTINKKLLDKFLKYEETKLPHFKSQTANRSLLTYFFHSTLERENNADVANVLGSRLRGHQSKDTLKNYVMSCNNDGLIDDVSFNLFKRGHFGWLYNSLIDIVVEGKKTGLTTKEKTEIIRKYQELYTPNNIEIISRFFLEQQSKLESIALEIASMPNDTLENILDKVFKGLMPSRDNVGQCIYSKNCKSPKGSCNSCFYIIPKIYLLYSLRDELQRAIERLRNAKEYETLERIRTTSILFKLMGLLNQASVEFGKEYVNSFIDLTELRTSLNTVNNKLLRAQTGV